MCELEIRENKNSAAVRAFSPGKYLEIREEARFQSI